MRKETILMSIALLCVVVQGAFAWEGKGTVTDPYLVQSFADWKQLSDDVSGGNSYSGKFFEMTANVDANGVSVGTEDKPFSGTFSGTFSGAMYTLTYSRGEINDQGVQAVNDYCAPFVRLDGATIRHLKVTGEIYSSHKYAAGIDCIQTIDEDGTSRYYDLNGRELPGKPAQGMFIYNGKKYINK